MTSFKKILFRGLAYYGMLRFGLWALRLTSNTLFRTVRAIQSHKSLYGTKNGDSYAVITGGSGGLGFEFAKQLAALGFNIVLIARDMEKLEKCAEQLRSSYEIAVRCIKFDFSKAEDSQAWIKLADDLRELDIAILVNNLGGYSWTPFDKQAEDEIQALLQNCMLTTTFMTRIVVPGMLQRTARSAVINIGSFAGDACIPTTAVNCGTKRYVHRLTLCLAREYEDKRIDFLCVIPGMIETPGLASFTAGTPTLVSSPESVVSGALSHVKTAHLRGHISHATTNMALFNWLLVNPITRGFFVKRTFGLKA